MDSREDGRKRSRNSEQRQLFSEFLLKEEQRIGIVTEETGEFNKDSLFLI